MNTYDTFLLIVANNEISELPKEPIAFYDKVITELTNKTVT